MIQVWAVISILWGCVSLCLVIGAAVSGYLALEVKHARLKRNDARFALWLLAAAVFPPLLLAPMLRGLRDIVRAADLPTLLPGPKEQSPGQLSIAAKQGGEVSEVRDVRV